MQKKNLYRLGLVLVCLSLAQAACGLSPSPAEDKSGSTSAVATAPAAATVASAAGYPNPPVQAQAAQPTSAGDLAPNNTQSAQAQPTQPVVVPTVPPASTAPATPPAPAAPTAPVGQNTILVTKPDGSQVTLTGADLQKLAPTEVSIGQSDQSGYRLSDVLAAAGVTDYQQVIVIGSGGATPLAKAQVTDDVILSTVDPTSLQLAGAQLTPDQMVKGVNQLQAK